MFPSHKWAPSVLGTHCSVWKNPANSNTGRFGMPSVTHCHELFHNALKLATRDCIAISQLSSPGPSFSSPHLCGMLQYTMKILKYCFTAWKPHNNSRQATNTQTQIEQTVLLSSLTGRNLCNPITRIFNCPGVNMDKNTQSLTTDLSTQGLRLQTVQDQSELHGES